MSHPEYTLKEIIERRDKKIKALEDLLHKIISMYELRISVNTPENRKFLLSELDKVRKI